MPRTRPDPAWWPLALARGRLLSAQDGRAHWQDEFRTIYLLSGGGEQPENPARPTRVNLAFGACPPEEVVP